ncbi:MAG: sigma-70 family RNA polymerase sigma factor [Chloracidobacterium sp.]|nr:sigma-70 family RNA polymerase sigma factor [Chloracidobacterium sp.]
MPAPDPHQVTLLLNKWSDGDEMALEELMPLVYDELRVMAKRYLSGQNRAHTFQTTELIHEAYLKLAGGEKKDWENRAHFFGVAALAMRHILVNYAVSKRSQKRGGDRHRVTLDDDSVVSIERTDEIVALNEALTNLETLDQRKGRVVELRYFGGMSIDETASVLKVSPQTVQRDWRFAKSWLMRELTC